jgi:hypothetical protein
MGPSGSEATGWNHYDGAREITLGAVSGDDGTHHVRNAFRTRHREEESILTAQKRPGPVYLRFTAPRLSRQGLQPPIMSINELAPKWCPVPFCDAKLHGRTIMGSRTSGALERSLRR